MITYKQLSPSLKWAFLGGWIALISFAVDFFIGFFMAL